MDHSIGLYGGKNADGNSLKDPFHIVNSYPSYSLIMLKKETNMYFRKEKEVNISRKQIHKKK